jgi:hypothetical protein
MKGGMLWLPQILFLVKLFQTPVRMLRNQVLALFLYRINERKRRKIRKNVKKQSIFLLTGGLKSDIMGVPLSEGSFFALKSKKSS